MRFDQNPPALSDDEKLLRAEGLVHAINRGLIMALERRQQEIHETLKNCGGIQFLRKLMAELNYDFAGDRLPTRDWADAAREPLAADPQLFATAAEGEFHVIYVQLKGEQLLRSAERQIINSLLGDHPYALFVFSNGQQNHWHVINVKHDVKHDKRRVLRRITIGVDERLRTASERIAMLDVENMASSFLGVSPLEIQKRQDEAFDVQPVTREFYRDYDRVFKRVEEMIEGFDDESIDKEEARREKEGKRLYTQRLFNRLMFIGFIQKKGWLKFEGNTDYLAALWRDYERQDSVGQNFYRERLKPLFFQGLSTSNEVNIIGGNRGGFLKTLIGDVPYLNGGLFEESEDGSDSNQKIVVPDEALDAIINDLFERYNFTATESTPFDMEVAVDPEMLGKVFEELVTGRNESGSYYTPKPVVSFMCRESLKGFLGSKYRSLIDEHDPSNISVPEARQLLSRLAEVRVVDPACGSGAYLLGMLHELHALVRLLDTRVEQETTRDDYHRKLQIITSNLYGVDKDEFAVQIARLRLWLSLAVEYEGAEPEPLPNLDFKIESGDTLTVPGPEQGTFVESVVNRSGGFDIVLANPPYGASVEDRVRDLYFDRRTEGAQSKDTYGLFIARGLQLLATGGQLCYIVSDTWRTIKSHTPLRRRLFEKTTIKHVLDLPGWIFDATVTTGILTLTKQPAPDGHQLIAGDLRSIAPGDWESLTKNLLAVAEHSIDVQTTEYARYTFPQELIGSYDNYSFFIGSPGLHERMSGERFIRLGEIAYAPHGISTGNNKKYVRAEPDVRGTYDAIEDWMKMPLEEMKQLTDKEKVEGVNKDWKKLRGCFVPFEKGGEAHTSDGWLPNYYAPTRYYINWSKGAIDDMRKNKGSAWKNERYFFKEGLTFSISGVYAPTFRLNSAGVFEAKGSGIFCDSVSPEILLGILCSKWARYQFKCYIKHTVDTSGDDIKEFRLVIPDAESSEQIRDLVSSIIEKQKADPRYPYHLHEQKEIDRLVYELYGLNEEDIREVELWYCRRYTRLAETQGVMAEVLEKYKDYLARCERILEK